MEKNPVQVNLIGAYAGLLAMTEIGLGGILHASRIPLRGQLLSLNQIFLLMRASSDDPYTSRLSPAAISSIAAVLKSLGPIGNKLTPMLAIATQGVLFTFGIVLFGHNFFGRLVGGILSSFWAFLQPILLYGLLLGPSGERALKTGIKELTRVLPLTEEMLLYTVIGIVMIKVVIVILMSAFVKKLPQSWIASYSKKISGFMPTQEPKKQTKKEALRGAYKQLCKPFFLLSVALTALILFLAERNYSVLIRHLLQPLALGFVVFFGMRLLPLDKIASRLEKQSSPFSQALRLALEKVRSL